MHSYHWTEIYPTTELTICFSLYLGLEMRLTASMCPTSTLYPRIYVKMTLATYLQPPRQCIYGSAHIICSLLLLVAV